MKHLRTTIVIGLVALLGGCVVAPPADYGYYAAPPAYYTPAPYYYAPSVRFGFGYYGGYGHRHWR